jgi:SOS-response transcriptional repressor LexA
MIRVTPLTRRQRQVYDYIVAFTRDHAYAPSLEEIAEAMELSSLATIHKHLSNLAERGYIARAWNRARSITILVGPGCCPTCGRELEKLSDEAKVSIESERKVCNDKAVGEVAVTTTPT